MWHYSKHFNHSKHLLIVGISVPGTPRSKIKKSTKEMGVIDVNHEKKYRSRIRILMYSTKYSRPDIYNFESKLFECMDSETRRTYNVLLHVVKFFIDTETFGLKVTAKLENDLGWNLMIFCHVDWAGEPETRINIIYFVI
jgi:hypothetical protein